MKKTIVIGIAGGTASGKTSISKQLKECYEDTSSVVIIRQDDYYKDQSHLTMEERVKTNYDHPLAFDNDLFVEQLLQLIKGEVIQKPTYDFVEHTRSDVVERIEPSDVIVIEGLFILEDEKLRNLCDIRIYVDTDDDIRFIRRLKRDVKKRGRDVIVIEGLFILEDEKLRNLCDIRIYVDTDDDIRFIRRLKRDVKKRGRTLESVIDQYLATVKPMHDQFIEPSKRYADVIIPEGGHNTVAIDLLITKISSIIHENML